MRHLWRKAVCRLIGCAWPTVCGPGASCRRCTRELNYTREAF